MHSRGQLHMDECPGPAPWFGFHYSISHKCILIQIFNWMSTHSAFSCPRPTLWFWMHVLGQLLDWMHVIANSFIWMPTSHSCISIQFFYWMPLSGIDAQWLSGTTAPPTLAFCMPLHSTFNFTIRLWSNLSLSTVGYLQHWQHFLLLPTCNTCLRFYGVCNETVTELLPSRSLCS